MINFSCTFPNPNNFFQSEFFLAHWSRFHRPCFTIYPSPPRFLNLLMPLYNYIFICFFYSCWTFTSQETPATSRSQSTPKSGLVKPVSLRISGFGSPIRITRIKISGPISGLNYRHINPKKFRYQ